jgi:hypothetical protein
VFNLPLTGGQVKGRFSFGSKNFPELPNVSSINEAGMITTVLRDSTIKLLKNRPVWMTLDLISMETTIPVGWLKSLSQDKIENPSVNRIETLKNYLENKVK